ncbi:MarR family transcriptional regulator [Streptomyces sp. ME19-01-6]|uniref:MarR family winged helix-turn-helix transcriptional regulator n=1 Tax=Streptomyces sp. ME19-01-6 TaxID=3028686 RepID=UPI0029A680CC|nr:MarR family transcriptional regulator [Streptomyces sp. ME19-01-6]MDX3226435.1 MarR family transcriptional regulator [Streptomyces sp. ME19-01-6]
MTGDAPPHPLASRLGYLLKHVHLQLTEASARALAPFGIDGRELAVLAVLATDNPLSQLEAARRLGVDRTTMVALIDVLEDKGLVERRRSAQDRRKNTVQLTPTGQDCLHRAEHAREEMERQFLAPLAGPDADSFVRALQTLVIAPRTPDSA